MQEKQKKLDEKKAQPSKEVQAGGSKFGEEEELDPRVRSVPLLPAGLASSSTDVL